jgi:hypothetical protein
MSSADLEWEVAKCRVVSVIAASFCRRTDWFALWLLHTSLKSSDVVSDVCSEVFELLTFHRD